MSAVPASNTNSRDSHSSLTIALANESPVVLLGLAQALQSVADTRVVVQVDSIVALHAAVERLDVDIVILDPYMRSATEKPLVPHLRAMRPSIQVVLYCPESDDVFAQQCVSNVGCVSVSRAASLDELRRVVTSLQKNVHSQRRLPSPIRASAPALSKSENRIVSLVAEGMPLTAISQQLGLSVKTVSTHKINAQNKLGATGTTELLRRWQLLRAISAY